MPEEYYKIKACCEICANYVMIGTPKFMAVDIRFGCGDEGKELPEEYYCGEFVPCELLEPL